MRLPVRVTVATALVLAGGIASLACGSGRVVAVSPPPAERAEDALPRIENELGPRPYRRLVAGTLELLATYWDNQLPDLGVKPKLPKGLVSYWNRRQDEGCGGRPAGPYNAQYCARSQTISWDGNWLYGDLYRRVGDSAVAFLLAHEYAHFVQDRLGIAKEFPLTIEAELNADCLAGAWFGSVDAKVARLRGGDFDALVGALIDVGDPDGVPWENPSAHGTAEERGDALSLGADEGQRACLRELGPGFSR